MSTTDTNVGPREGPVKGLSQLMDTPMDGTSQYTLPPRGTLNKVIPVEQKRKLVRKVMYPRLCKLTELAGFKYEENMEEIAWANFEENVVPDSITSTLINVVRQLDAKGKEWLTYNVVLRGTDKDGKVLGGIVVEHGVDFEPQIKSIRNSEHVVTNLQLGNKTTPIYTEEYSKEKLQEILSGEKYEISPKLSLTIAEANGKSWGGCSQLEFEELDKKELLWRCKYNHVNEDIDVSFSTMSTKDKLHLSKTP